MSSKSKILHLEYEQDSTTHDERPVQRQTMCTAPAGASLYIIVAPVVFTVFLIDRHSDADLKSVTAKPRVECSSQLIATFLAKSATARADIPTAHQDFAAASKITTHTLLDAVTGREKTIDKHSESSAVHSQCSD